jgi:glycosyltransferase involved in cell wall biosynthesis
MAQGIATILERTISSASPIYTVVTPTFEHARSIETQLDATLAAASLPFDWILVDDASQDDTADRIVAWMRACAHALVARATVLRHDEPCYETACDNLGFRRARTDPILEVQADIHVHEAGYDALMLGAARAGNPTPSSVSGRCGHSFAALKRRSILDRLRTRDRPQYIGLCGRAIATPEIVEPLRGHIYRCETVNRGPWLVFKTDLERHDYLDEENFFLGNDDHDYHRRLFQAEGRRPVYTPMRLTSPLAEGAARRTRTGVNASVYQRLKAEKRGSPAFHRFLADLATSTPPERIA